VDSRTVQDNQAGQFTGETQQDEVQTVQAGTVQSGQQDSADRPGRTVQSVQQDRVRIVGQDT